ncbi:MAG: SRPBCC family protein [Acidimicrobiia bacterium]|nr:SRPBCC family protein [Acidimicrobiia bacterium]
MTGVRVVNEIVIDRPPDVVFAYIADVANNPLWQRGMREAHFTSGPPLRVGSTYAQVATFVGRRIESRFAIVEYEPGRLVKGSTTVSPFPITFTRIVDPEGGGSRVTAIVEGRPDGLFALASPLVRRMVKASVARDYDNLKRLLEG